MRPRRSPPGRTQRPGELQLPTGTALYVDRQGPAALQAARWRAQGRRKDAAAIAQIAARPTAVWIADESDVAARARGDLEGRGRRAGSAAGRLSRPRTRLRQLLRRRLGLVGRVPRLGARVRARAREPPGGGRPRAGRDPAGGPGTSASPPPPRRSPLAAALCGPDAARATRASVYLDVGNPGRIQPAARLLGPLRRSGIRAADGFALNVSNFYRTQTAVSLRAGAAAPPGRRPLRDRHEPQRQRPSVRDDAGGLKWCNPPRPALGRDPTTSTGEAKVDAYLGSRSLAPATAPAASAFPRRATGGPSTR